MLAKYIKVSRYQSRYQSFLVLSNLVIFLFVFGQIFWSVLSLDRKFYATRFSIHEQVCWMRHFFSDTSVIIGISISRWKYLSKRSLIKRSSLWRGKLITLWTPNREAKLFYISKCLLITSTSLLQFSIS